MLERAKEVVDMVSQKTDSIILMHSLSGKDSIALLDLVYPKFKRVVCVFMYIVPNLRHIGEYLAYARKKYPNAEFVQTPHYALYAYMREGYLGCAKNPKQRRWRLTDIIENIKRKTGIAWMCCGFKQSDSLNRRLMLRSYKDGLEAVSWKSKNFYPLSTYKNADVLAYISERNLKKPERYGVAQSAGTDVSDYYYLKYLAEKYPDDLAKVYRAFPGARATIMTHEAKRDNDNTEEPD